MKQACQHGKDLLRQAEVELAQAKRIGEVCGGLGISEQSYYRWRSESAASEIVGR